MQINNGNETLLQHREILLMVFLKAIFVIIFIDFECHLFLFV